MFFSSSVLFQDLCYTKHEDEIIGKKRTERKKIRREKKHKIEGRVKKGFLVKRRKLCVRYVFERN